MFVTLDHLGVVVGGSREWDVVLRRKLPSWCDLLERDLVAVTESAWCDYSEGETTTYKAISRWRSTENQHGNIQERRVAHRQKDPHR